MDGGKKTLDLIGRIYDAAREWALWSDFAGEAVRALGASNGAVALFDSRSGESSLFQAAEMESSFQQSYQTYYGGLDPINPHLAKLPVGTAACSHHFYSLTQIRRLEFYNDWALPQEGAFSLGGWAVKDSDSVFGIGIQRSLKAGPFEPQQVRLLETLLPHMRRAFVLSRHLSASEAGRESAQAALDRLELGVVLMDAAGRAVHLNHRAEQIVRRGDALSIKDKRITPCLPGEAEKLRKLIHEAVHTGNGSGLSPGSSLLLHGADSGPLRLLVSPLRCDRDDLGIPGSRICAALFISETGATAAVPVHALQALYGLTPAEGRLAVELARGHGLEEIAARFEISKETARNQLKAVFAKTDTHRQAQLAALLLSGPAAVVREA